MGRWDSGARLGPTVRASKAWGPRRGLCPGALTSEPPTPSLYQTLKPPTWHSAELTHRNSRTIGHCRPCPRLGSTREREREREKGARLRSHTVAIATIDLGFPFSIYLYHAKGDPRCSLSSSRSGNPNDIAHATFGFQAEIDNRSHSTCTSCKIVRNGSHNSFFPPISRLCRMALSRHPGY